MSTIEFTAAPPAFATDEARWQAVMRRDPAADGQFVYAVVTTGIYCRPTCPARRARRENVRFYDSPREAAADGFRPCKRCRPAERGPAAEHAERIASACRAIAQSPVRLTLAELAASAGMSPFHFHRLFKAHTGVTPKAFAAAVRAERLRGELRRGEPVTRAQNAAGYGSSSRLYDAARLRLGMKPSTYRRGGAGEILRFAISTCWLGTILVAASERGVCAILMGDDAEELTRDLASRFPQATLVPGDGDFQQLVAAAVALVNDPAGGASNLPLDIRGTAFQQQVWEALRALPPGSTTTYTDLAAKIGRPSAVRAVAHACASNALAVVVPCHRVVRSDGQLAGYRWGLERKRRLLEREKDANS